MKNDDSKVLRKGLFEEQQYFDSVWFEILHGFTVTEP